MHSLAAFLYIHSCYRVNPREVMAEGSATLSHCKQNCARCESRKPGTGSKSNEVKGCVHNVTLLYTTGFRLLCTFWKSSQTSQRKAPVYNRFLLGRKELIEEKNKIAKAFLSLRFMLSNTNCRVTYCISVTTSRSTLWGPHHWRGTSEDTHYGKYLNAPRSTARPCICGKSRENLAEHRKT